jgi:hypothetical protein
MILPMQHIPSTPTAAPLAEAFAGLRHSCAQMSPHALAITLLLRLLASLESLARAWTHPARPRRLYPRGKGPTVRDWMAPCHPTRKLRPAAPPPPHCPHARTVRAPPLRAPTTNAAAPGLRPAPVLRPALFP